MNEFDNFETEITAEEYYKDELDYDHLERDCDEHYEPDYDDSMDGDHESALASAGWGTDEDYGCSFTEFDDIPF